MKEANISPELKLEILKRDNFTCQYCHKAAPKVYLCVDYVTVFENDNFALDDPTNLICCCAQCHNERHEHGRIIMTPLTMAEERLEQFFQYTSFLPADLRIHSEMIKHIEAFINGKLNYEFVLTRQHLFPIEKELRRHEYPEVIQKIDDAFYNSIKIGPDDKITEASFNTFITNIPKYLYHSCRTPVEQTIHFLKGTIASRYGERYRTGSTQRLAKFRYELNEAGYTDNQVRDIIQTKVKPIPDFESTYLGFCKRLDKIQQEALERE